MSPGPDSDPPPSNVPSAAGFASGMAQGAWAGAKSMASGLYDLGSMATGGYKQLGALAKELYNDPQARHEAMEAAKAVAREARDFGKFLAEDPEQTLATAKDGALAAANAAKAKGSELYGEAKQEFADARARGEGSEFVGKAVGRAAFEIGSLLVGVGEASKAGKLAEVGELSKMGEVETVVMPCGKVVAKAEFEAAEAARTITETGTKFTSEAVKKSAELTSRLAKASGDEARQIAEELAGLSTHQVGDANRAVLGKWPGYIEEAKKGGTWFETPPDFFDQLKAEVGTAEAKEKAWLVNEAFLKKQVAEGKAVEFTKEGLDHALRAPQSMTAREVELLSKLLGEP